MGVEADCHNQEELYNHVVINDRRTPIGWILQNPSPLMDPTVFITDESLAFIKLYQDVDKWGIGFLYKNIDDVPHRNYQAFNIISNAIKAHEIEQYKSLKKDNKANG